MDIALPVLPLEASTMVSPGRSSPSASAFSIMYFAIRALIDPDGLRNSSFTHIPSTRISGVLPMLSSTVACHASVLRPAAAEASRLVMTGYCCSSEEVMPSSCIDVQLGGKRVG